MGSHTADKVALPVNAVSVSAVEAALATTRRPCDCVAVPITAVAWMQHADDCACLRPYISWVTTSEPITVPCETCGGKGGTFTLYRENAQGDAIPPVLSHEECPRCDGFGRRPVQPGDQIELEAGEVDPEHIWYGEWELSELIDAEMVNIGWELRNPEGRRIPLPASGQTVGAVTVRTANVPIYAASSDQRGPGRFIHHYKAFIPHYKARIMGGPEQIWHTYVCDRLDDGTLDYYGGGSIRDISGQIVQPQPGRYATEIETVE